jgi:SAM-dependent methyltransferase
LYTNRYGSLASHVYQLDKPVGHSFGDVEFYLDALRGLRGPVLEPAVGSGRVIIPLLQAGLDVEGFDASPEMLAICRENCEAAGLTPRLSQARFEDFSCDRPVEAIIMPVGSFHLITSFETAMAVFESFHAHLAPAGRLLIDLSVASGIHQAGPRTRHWYDAAGDRFTLHESPAELDGIAQLATFHHRYEQWRNGNLVRSESELFAMRWWSMEEFRLALIQTGFATVCVYGDYDRAASPGPGHRTLTFEATRLAI